MPSTSHDSHELETLKDRIRAVGLRSTSARLAVLRVLLAAHAPLSHAEVVERLASSGFDKATVFRNLVDLVQADLLMRTELGDHVWRYEVRDPAHSAGGGHPHFVCTDCGGVTCLSELDFDDRSQAAASKIGRVTEILLKGVCNDCR